MDLSMSTPITRNEALTLATHYSAKVSEPTLSQTIKEISSNCHMTDVERTEAINALLVNFTAENLPDAKTLGISQFYWLEIYYNKKGAERGTPLTDAEKAWDIPGRSDPLCWSSEDWESYLD